MRHRYFFLALVLWVLWGFVPLLGCTDQDVGDGVNDETAMGEAECIPGKIITAKIAVPKSFAFDETTYAMAVSFMAKKQEVPMIPCVTIPDNFGEQNLDVKIDPEHPFTFQSTHQGLGDDWGGAYYVGVALFLEQESFPLYAEWVWFSEQTYELNAGCNINLGEIVLSRNGDVHHSEADRYCQ